MVEQHEECWSLYINITLPPNIDPAASIRMQMLYPEDLQKHLNLLKEGRMSQECHNRASRPDLEHIIN